jgi:uncharacterized protein YfkK (UPF0435 family)
MQNYKKFDMADIDAIHDIFKFLNKEMFSGFKLAIVAPQGVGGSRTSGSV